MKKNQIVLALLLNSVVSINIKNMKSTDWYQKSKDNLLFEISSESQTYLGQEDES